MLPYRDGRITRMALALFFVLIIGYAYYEARGVMYGPRIEVPTDAMVVSDQFIVIRGSAERIAELSMNGRPISVTEAGAFEEPYLLARGLNRIMLDATDRYGRKTQEVVQIIYTPDPHAPTPTREQTAAASTTLGPRASTSDEVAP